MELHKIAYFDAKRMKRNYDEFNSENPTLQAVGTNEQVHIFFFYLKIRIKLKNDSAV